jgi:glycosyltransferase involved in cell wall biosynthesis
VRETTCDAALAQGMLTAKEKSFQKYIVIPGRIERVKGQVFFVQALTTELIERIRSTNTLIVFAGGGSDERELKNRVPDNLLGNVLITGTLEHAMLLSFMSLADLVVIPSLSEGFGITLVESMMLKRNVISSNAGGLKETIHGSNVIEWFSCGNAAALQQKIAAFFAGELSFQPEEAYTHYRANFSPEAYREALLQYLNHTLPA